MGIRIEDKISKYLDEAKASTKAKISAYFKSITKDKDMMKKVETAAQELGGDYTFAGDNLPPRAKYVSGGDTKMAADVLKKHGIKVTKTVKDKVYFE